MSIKDSKVGDFDYRILKVDDLGLPEIENFPDIANGLGREQWRTVIEAGVKVYNQRAVYKGIEQPPYQWERHAFDLSDGNFVHEFSADNKQPVYPITHGDVVGTPLGILQPFIDTAAIEDLNLAFGGCGIMIKAYQVKGGDDGSETKKEVGEVYFDGYVTMSGIPRHACEPTCVLKKVTDTIYGLRIKGESNFVFTVQFEFSVIMSIANQGCGTLSVDHWGPRDVDDAIRRQCLGPQPLVYVGEDGKEKPNKANSGPCRCAPGCRNFRLALPTITQSIYDKMIEAVDEANTAYKEAQSRYQQQFASDDGGAGAGAAGKRSAGRRSLKPVAEADAPTKKQRKTVSGKAPEEEKDGGASSEEEEGGAGSEEEEGGAGSEEEEGGAGSEEEEGGAGSEEEEGGAGSEEEEGGAGSEEEEGDEAAQEKAAAEAEKAKARRNRMAERRRAREIAADREAEKFKNPPPRKESKYSQKSKESIEWYQRKKYLEKIRKVHKAEAEAEARAKSSSTSEVAPPKEKTTSPSKAKAPKKNKK